MRKFFTFLAIASALSASAIDWESVENLATHKPVTCRIAAQVENDSNPPENAVDGDTDTYYEYFGGYGGGESWVIVDLGTEHVVDAVGALTGDYGGTIRFSFGVEGAQMPDQDKFWLDPIYTGWTQTSTMNRVNGEIVTYEPEAPIKARYIAVRDISNPGGKPKLYEIYISGEEHNPVPTEMSLTFEPGGLFVGETATINCSILDQYGNVYDNGESPKFSITGGATLQGNVITATEVGPVTVTATIGDFTQTARIAVADVNDYAMLGATVTSDNENAVGDYAFDGGPDPRNHGQLYVVTESGEGANEHWILAELAKSYDLDMIIAIWEGACPRDYDVYVGSDPENLEMLYSVRGHYQATWYDRFSGKDMKNVKYIKIITTYTATGWGIKLFDLKAYGKSDQVSVPTSVQIVYNGYNGEDNYVELNNAVILKGTVYDQFGAPMNDLAVEYGVNVNNVASENYTLNNDRFTATTRGDYAVYATYDGIRSDDFIIHFEPRVREYESALMGENPTSANPLVNEVQFPDLNVPLTITFKEPLDITLIKLNWEAACPGDYTVVAKYVGGGESTVFSLEGRAFMAGVNPTDRVWDDNGNLKNVESLVITPTNRIGHGYTIRLFSAETYAYPSNYEKIATNVTLTSDINHVATDEQVNFISKVYDQFGDEMEADVTIYDQEGLEVSNPYTPVAIGTYRFYAQLSDNTLRSDDFILIVSSDKSNPDTYETVTFNEENNSYVIEYAPEGSDVDAYAVKDIDLITLEWSKSPKAYTVEAEYFEYVEWEKTAILEVSGREGNESVTDRIYHANIYDVPQNDAQVRILAAPVEANNELRYVRKLTITPTDYADTAELNSVKVYAANSDTTGVEGVAVDNEQHDVDVYNLQGVRVRANVNAEEALGNLPAGIYIVNGKKIMVR